MHPGRPGRAEPARPGGRPCRRAALRAGRPAGRARAERSVPVDPVPRQELRQETRPEHHGAQQHEVDRGRGALRDDPGQAEPQRGLLRQHRQHQRVHADVQRERGPVEQHEPGQPGPPAGRVEGEPAVQEVRGGRAADEADRLRRVHPQPEPDQGVVDPEVDQGAQHADRDEPAQLAEQAGPGGLGAGRGHRNRVAAARGRSGRGVDHVQHAGAEGLLADQSQRVGRRVLEEPLSGSDRDRVHQQVQLVQQTVGQQPAHRGRAAGHTRCHPIPLLHLPHPLRDVTRTTVVLSRSARSPSWTPRTS